MTTAQLIGADPGWLIAVKALFVFVICVLLTLMSVWAERRIVGRMQQRPGPNRVGPFGLIQALADGVKLALKEDIMTPSSPRCSRSTPTSKARSSATRTTPGPMRA